MKLSHVVAAAASLVVGAILVLVFRPDHGPERVPQATLVDGKYLVVEDSGGHWVYEKTADGWAVKVRQLGPEGLAAIWGLQAKFIPYAVDTGGGMLINVPATQYSTETGAFQVVHHFYRYQEDKLVEVQLVPTKPQ